MRTLIISALAATLCVAPAMAQPQDGAQMFPAQPNEQKFKARPAEVNLQIKEDLQALAQTFNQGSEFFAAENYIFAARIGFFGASEWKRNLKSQLNGNLIQIDDAKIIERAGDTVKVAVAYSFKPSPALREAQPEFWRGARQEILNLKLGPMIYETEHMVWQIVPPLAPPPAFNLNVDADPQDNLFINIAYYLAQKQVLQITGTPEEHSVENLKQLGLGVAQLVQDYDEVYAFAPRYLIEAVTPYVRNPTVFQIPDTNEIYTFNANLSGLKLADINEVYQTVLFYEGQNETPVFRYDGKAAIGFADGHVALIAPDEARKLIWKP